MSPCLGRSHRALCPLLAELPQESDGKAREGWPRREDDSHGSQPVSTSRCLLLALLLLSPGTLLFAPIPPPFPTDEVENSQQSTAKAGSRLWGNLGTCGPGFLGSLPVPNLREMPCLGLCQPFKVNDAGFGGQRQKSCRASKENGFGFGALCPPVPSQTGQGPGRGGNAPGFRLESHKFYWGWSNVHSYL